MRTRSLLVLDRAVPTRGFLGHATRHSPMRCWLSPERAAPSWDVLCWAALGVSACSGQSDQAPPPVFGGTGATVAAPSQLATPVAGSSLDSGPCAKPSPAGDVTLVDDFEDADAKPFKAFEREGWWYVATDDSAGSVTPPKGKFQAEALPEGESSTSNRYAAHFAASGYEDWGVVWGSSLNWSKDGIRCPYNAAAFAGLRFRAKGQGTLGVKLGVPETQPREGGGSCEERCYDAHTQVVHIQGDWQEYIIRFDRLQQGGWGAQARFDRARVLGLVFAADPNTLPVDVWVDDIEFLTPARLAGSLQTAPLGSAPSQGHAGGAGAKAVATPATSTTPAAAGNTHSPSIQP
jgi:hypothetical protein